jgi:hypothetical protein
MSKLFSGRWIFTIVVAFVFAALALKGTLPQDKVSEIILLVIYAYFTKPPAGGLNGKTTPPVV